MEFTEVQELNNITLHARSFVPGQALSVATPVVSNYQPSTTQTIAPILMFDYEKALRDTPPASPSSSFVYKKPEKMTIFDKENNESIEDLLANIKNSIIDYSEINDVSTEPSQTQPAEKQSSIKVEEEPDTIVDEKDDEDEKPADGNKGQHQFEKITEDFVSKTYIETKNLKSFLSSSIKAFPMNNDYNAMKRAEVKTFKVYFLTDKYSTLLPLSLGIPVSDVIKRCLEAFKLNKAISEGVMRYPDRPDAYQLQKDTFTGALDKGKALKDLKVGRELIVAEVKGFDPSKPYVEAGGQSGKGENSLMTITLHLPTDDRSKMTIQMGPERQLKDVFARLALQGKSGFNMQNYNIRLYSSDPETRWKEAKNFLDLNIPLKNIKPFGQDEEIQIEFVKKKFADEPSERPSDHRDSTSGKKSAAADRNQDAEDQIILYNEVSASHYEEFEVTKINENGKKQERVLGIDGFKLYNYSKGYKQEQGGRIGEIFNTLFLSKFGTMNPERLLTDIYEAKFITGKLFQIAVNSEGKPKWQYYEAVDNKTANQIVAKINYLKGIQRKNN